MFNAYSDDNSSCSWLTRDCVNDFPFFCYLLYFKILLQNSQVHLMSSLLFFEEYIVKCNLQCWESWVTGRWYPLIGFIATLSIRLHTGSCACYLEIETGENFRLFFMWTFKNLTYTYAPIINLMNIHVVTDTFTKGQLAAVKRWTNYPTMKDITWMIVGRSQRKLQ